MRTVEWVRLAAVAGAAITAVLVASRGRLVRSLETAEAFKPDRAIQVAPRSPLGRFWLGRLVGAGVLQATPTGSYWLRRESWAVYRATRRRRALLIVIFLLMVLTSATWFLRPR